MSLLEFVPSAAEAGIIWLTIAVACRAVLTALPLALLAALLLRALPALLRVPLNLLINLPLMLPPVVTGWLLLMSFGRQGAAGIWLWRVFGLRLPFTTAGAALACAVMVLPLMTRHFRHGLDCADPGLLEAARTLGAGPLDRFQTITMPLAAPAMLAGITMGFTASLGEFGAVITFAASIPGETRTLPLAIYAALSQPDGDQLALHLALFSIVLAIGGFTVSEILLRRLNR
jgi:molybdate transport system permease protein